ncbi:hypothetical protein [Algoriphagus machipongonensis]|uniref:DoxX family protein n=1 Tax=Algoriphagus machipongonensis TaxID=388413 RepID=A3HWH5_9BACT|nr:hypothetical protein [Algoriphagus machipongonensis]EAZ80948.1 hypothetical protein ALPR1_17968 [Algoriphagus machipongonensis]
MKITSQLGRLSLFTIYFWFGILKVLGYSPAEALVQNLFSQTIGTWLDFNLFCIGFGFFECALGILWLFPKLSKISLYILIAHMLTTFLPVLVLTEEIWQSWFTPTLVGQYIIKNLALISLALFISKSYEQEQLELKRESKSLMKFEGFTSKLVS